MNYSYGVRLAKLACVLGQDDSNEVGTTQTRFHSS